MKELVELRFGGSVERFTRTVPLLEIVRDEYSAELLHGIQNLSQFMRNVVIRVMLFVDIYIVQHAHSSIPTYVFSQQFFYSMAQLVLGQEITNDNPNLPDDLLDSWNSVKTQYPALIYRLNNFKYYAQTLASACNVINDAYTNIIVEYFRSRVEKYIKLQKFVPAMQKNIASKIANDYLYEILAGGNPVMPRYLLPCSIEIDNAIQEIWMELMPYMPRPCTTEEMAANMAISYPRYITFYSSIMTSINRRRISKRNQIRALYPRLFSLVPLPSRNWKFIDINAETLAGLPKMPVPRTYNQRLTVFQTVLNLDKYRFFKDEGCMFTNQITTNGYQTSFHCARSKKERAIELELDDFSINEISSYHRPCALDPGRRDVFNASYGCGSEVHEVRKCSTAEYYGMTGLPSQPISAIRSTLDVEREQPPVKEKKWRKARVNCDNNGIMPLIVFGSGMFGKDGVPLKGRQSGVVGILWRELKKREANSEVTVVKIDEYLTSQTCHACLSRTLDNMITYDLCQAPWYPSLQKLWDPMAPRHQCIQKHVLDCDVHLVRS
ncbi:hypothetical protein VTP01DRAFT_3614 [Rhizomucor pusillus]|uniref:uncharacterized protein n=1 Tax=Rhizomucor pusillus TaxID=4840 RepID=UPI0037430426